jgi:predicted short-subunit dehydrogenase-like oxidoreductase (DUF2520 family)
MGQLVVHTAGRYGVDVLAPAAQAGAIGLAIHPAMTFTGTSLDLSRLESTTFAVSAPAPFAPIGQALVVELGGEPVLVPDEARGLYHAGLAHGANHLVVLVAQAAQALAGAGVTEPGRVLRPLLEAALDGALRSACPPGSEPDAVGVGAVGALTGPVRRGDAGTVAAHLAELSRWAADGEGVDVVESYRVLARAATVRALRAGLLDEPSAQALLDTLTPTGPEAG